MTPEMLAEFLATEQVHTGIVDEYALDYRKPIGRRFLVTVIGKSGRFIGWRESWNDAKTTARKYAALTDAPCTFV